MEEVFVQARKALEVTEEHLAHFCNLLGNVTLMKIILFISMSPMRLNANVLYVQFLIASDNPQLLQGWDRYSKLNEQISNILTNQFKNYELCEKQGCLVKPYEITKFPGCNYNTNSTFFYIL